MERRLHIMCALSYLVKATNVAWAAGVLEGEGTFLLPRTNSISIELAMTDEDVVERVRNVFGTGSVTLRAPRPGRKQIYRWSAHARGAYAVCAAIIGFMGERRAKRIRELMVHWRKVPTVAQSSKGRALGPEARRAKRLAQPTCARGHSTAQFFTYTRSGKAYCKGCARENRKQGSEPTSIAEARRARRLAQPTCSRGHPTAQFFTYSRSGSAYCKGCARERHQRNYQRMKDARNHGSGATSIPV